MKGKHHIIVENRKLRYEFDIKRNITVIRGDSATGKTTLIEMLTQYQIYGDDSGVNIVSDCPLIVANNSDWEFRVKNSPGAIIFMDEGNSAVVTEQFAKCVKSADAYFVLITRDKLANLPYSIDEIYGIRTSEKYAGLKQVYHELYNLYGDWKSVKATNDKLVIVEDSNSGYEFYTELYKPNNETKVISAEGKSNIQKLVRQAKDNNILVVADGAAFGSEIEGNMELLNNGYKIGFYLPESFEWVVLNSNIIEDGEVAEILHSPENYIDSQKYMSWERYFTDLLIAKTKDGYLRYNKSVLNKNYLKGNVFSAIKKSLPI